MRSLAWHPHLTWPRGGPTRLRPRSPRVAVDLLKAQSATGARARGSGTSGRRWRSSGRSATLA
eukprot:1208760-Pyramimonas_sp.AAC.1